MSCFHLLFCCQNPPQLEVDVGFEYRVLRVYAAYSCVAFKPEPCSIGYLGRTTTSARGTRTETFSGGPTPCNHEVDCSTGSWRETWVNTTTTTYSSPPANPDISFRYSGGGETTATYKHSRTYELTEDCKLLKNGQYIGDYRADDPAPNVWRTDSVTCGGSVEWTVTKTDDPEYLNSCSATFENTQDGASCILRVTCANGSTGTSTPLQGSSGYSNQFTYALPSWNPATTTYDTPASLVKTTTDGGGAYDNMNDPGYAIPTRITADLYSSLSEEYEATNVEYKLVHQPSPTCYLKVWIRKTEEVYSYREPGGCTADSPTEEPTITITDSTYEWQGSDVGQGLCLKPPVAGTVIYGTQPDENWKRNKVTSTFTGTLKSTATPGTTVFTDLRVLKYSFLPDYTPNDPDEYDQQYDKPNGFPAP